MARVVTYDEFYKRNVEEEDKVIDFKNKNCVDCDECCGMFTLITKQEFEDLKKYFKKNKIGKITYKRAIDRVLNFNKEVPNTVYLKCPLSNGKKRCDIYAKRPSICREFHCSKELNQVTDKLKNREHYIHELFMEDLLKDEMFKTKLSMFIMKLNNDVPK